MHSAAEKQVSVVERHPRPNNDLTSQEFHSGSYRLDLPTVSQIRYQVQKI